MGNRILQTSFIVLLLCLTLINLIPVFAPEIGFDALWYHLTLPKLWLESGQYFFPGDLLYYSAMPRLTETLFIPLLVLLGTSGPKLLQFCSGIATTLLIFVFVRKHQSPSLALINASFFYATHLVGWQSSSAYVDLFRTLLETSAILIYLTNHRHKLVLSALLWGLAIGTKWHSIVSLIVFASIFDLRLLPLGLIPAVPWFLLSLFYTGNPVFPLFSSHFDSNQFQTLDHNFYSLSGLITRLVRLPLSLLFPFDDWLSPAVGILTLPIVFKSFFSREKQIRRISLYALVMLIVWQLTPPPSSRYLLPLLPIIALLLFTGNKYRSLIVSIIFTSTLIVLPLRLRAVAKFVPVAFRHQSTTQFLEQNKGKLPGTFVDLDGFVANLPASSRLLTDFHNLYYFSKPVTHTSWMNPAIHYDFFITDSPKTDYGKLIHQTSWPVYVYQIP